MLGLTTVQELTSETPNAVDEVSRGACKLLYHLEGLLTSLDGVKGGGIRTGVISPVVVGESTWGGDGLGGK